MAINKVKQWPAWSEYKVQGTTEANDPEYLAVKKEIIEQYGADALYRSWLKVCRELENVTEEIAAKGNSMIPIFDTAEIISGGFTDEQQCEIKRVGAFVCRGTIPESETNLLYDNLKTFIKDNKQSIPAWPESSPSMYVLHNSPTQNALRSHPNHLNLQRVLNSLWHDATNETSAEPLLYLDGVRDREPGQAFLGLGPHIDAGSLCRWSEPIYRKTYENIFAGNPEKHDAFDLTIRKDADQEKYKGPAHSGVLRSFQGWTALTPAAPREGTIMVYPNVKTAIAYMLLRPFFSPPADQADIMDASKWSLDTESSWFPGTTKPQSQYLSRSSHPHLRLEECLVYMPKVQPGDTVWWHCDQCHAVDTEHLGSNNASVAFIAACPTTARNKEYVKEQLQSTLAGRAPPDCVDGEGLDESKLKGYVGLQGLSADAKRAFGFHLLEAATRGPCSINV